MIQTNTDSRATIAAYASQMLSPSFFGILFVLYDEGYSIYISDFALDKNVHHEEGNG